MSCSVYIDFVGGFWRPSKLSSKQCAKVFRWAMRELGPGPKPHVQFRISPLDGWLYMVVYRRMKEPS